MRNSWLYWLWICYTLSSELTTFSNVQQRMNWINVTEQHAEKFAKRSQMASLLPNDHHLWPLHNWFVDLYSQQLDPNEIIQDQDHMTGLSGANLYKQIYGWSGTQSCFKWPGMAPPTLKWPYKRSHCPCYKWGLWVLYLVPPRRFHKQSSSSNVQDSLLSTPLNSTLVLFFSENSDR